MWRPPDNYVAAARKLCGGRQILCGGRQIIMWRPPENYVVAARKLSGGRQIKYFYYVAPTGFRTKIILYVSELSVQQSVLVISS
jgi:hypothetical protein